MRINDERGQLIVGLGTNVGNHDEFRVGQFMLFKLLVQLFNRVGCLVRLVFFGQYNIRSWIRLCTKVERWHCTYRMGTSQSIQVLLCQFLARSLEEEHDHRLRAHSLVHRF